jgi:hypothetical protein
MSDDLVPGDKVEIQSAEEDDAQTAIATRESPFFSFRYFYGSMTSSGGVTRVTAREQRFEDGKLEHEELEATLPATVYATAAAEAQEAVASQMRALWSAWTPLLLPWLAGPKRDDEPR